CSCRACSAVMSSKLDHYNIDPIAQTMDKAYYIITYTLIHLLSTTSRILGGTSGNTEVPLSFPYYHFLGFI
ncbi:MAG: hypothetical protein QME81_04450, partial [bacterium]|nr:hypothetical protein [bacterium]